MAGKLTLKIASGILALSLIAGAAAVYSSADTLSDYQKKQKELDEKAAEYQAQIENTASNIAQREEYKKALQSKITVLNEQIANGRGEIEQLDIEITGLQNDIDESRSKISGRIEKLKQRVRALYVSGDTTSLEVILGAKDFTDFLDKLEIVTYISKSDQQLIDSLREDIEVINVKRNSLKDKKTALDNEQKTLNERQKEMQSLINENEKLLDNLYKENSGAQDHLDETTEEMKKVEAQIEAYFKDKKAQEETAKKAAEAKKKLEEEKAASEKAASEKAASAKASSTASTRVTDTYRISERNNSSASTSSEYEYDDEDENEDEDSDDWYEEDEPVSSVVSSKQESKPESKPEPEPEPESAADQSEGYVWPVPGHYTLSSVWNEDRTTYNHGAIDISDGSIMNAQIVAAEAGVVVLWSNDCTHNYGKDGSCGCGGGYGNYIMIDHGNGKATLYAHMTDVVVNEGDYVQKGQLVGYVGTTGWSTGPHLHFETRLNGEKYNPMTEYPNI